MLLLNTATVSGYYLELIKVGLNTQPLVKLSCLKHDHATDSPEGDEEDQVCRSRGGEWSLGLRETSEIYFHLLKSLRSGVSRLSNGSLWTRLVAEAAQILNKFYNYNERTRLESGGLDLNSTESKRV